MKSLIFLMILLTLPISLTWADDMANTWLHVTPDEWHRDMVGDTVRFTRMFDDSCRVYYYNIKEKTYYYQYSVLFPWAKPDTTTPDTMPPVTNELRDSILPPTITHRVVIDTGYDSAFWHIYQPISSPNNPQKPARYEWRIDTTIDTNVVHEIENKLKALQYLPDRAHPAED
ncbi:MAG: hypothetical protein KAR42_17700 [candidate division Zixibacteria bacterium]|nr:hypothetical protein [candidate division Zixibacteria bacterium]